MKRRTFIQQSATLALLWPVRGVSATPLRFITVRGVINPEELGYILPHEHILVDFGGAEKAGMNRYNRDAVYRRMLPLLQAARQAGCGAFFDCTPAYLGRDVQLLRSLSEATLLPIVTNTGYYSAVGHKYLPAHAFTETAEQLAARWVAECNDGIEGTGIRPGFIKISVDKHPLDVVDQKIVKAAALTHRATGLTIGSHTGSGEAALQQLDILAAEGVAAAAFVWIHAQNEKDHSLHQAAAKRGCWLEFDNLGWEPASAFLEHIRFMETAGYLRQMLISHDAGWYDVEQQGTNEPKPFTPLFTDLVPAMKATGWSNSKLRSLFHGNPVQAYAVRKRLTG